MKASAAPVRAGAAGAFQNRGDARHCLAELAVVVDANHAATGRKPQRLQYDGVFELQIPGLGGLDFEQLKVRMAATGEAQGIPSQVLALRVGRGGGAVVRQSQPIGDSATQRHAAVVGGEHAGDLQIGNRVHHLRQRGVGSFEVDRDTARDFRNQGMPAVGDDEDGHTERRGGARVGRDPVTSRRCDQKHKARRGARLCQSVSRGGDRWSGASATGRATAAADAGSTGFGEHVIEHETLAANL